MKPSTGRVTRPPITPPSPSVESSRKTERGHRVVGRTSGGQAAAPAWTRAAALRLGLDLRRLREPGGRGSGRGSRGTRRRRRSTAPIDDDRPARRRSRRGRRRRPRRGRRARGSALARADVRGSAPRRSQQISQVPTPSPERNRGSNYAGSPAPPLRRACVEAVLGPAPVDELADLGAHLDLGRPVAGALVGHLGGGVDPELAADELARRSRGRGGRRARRRGRRRGPGRRWRRRRRRPGRSRAGRRGRRRRSRPSSARAARAPRPRASPSAPAPGRLLRIETIAQLWNAPATGRS